jgi:hypothetical protein
VESRIGDEWSDQGFGSEHDGGSEISRAAIRKRQHQPSSRNPYGREEGGGRNVFGRQEY